MAKKTYPLSGVEDEQRARWQQRADAAGMSLASWIRETCDLRDKGLLVLAAEEGLDLTPQGQSEHDRARHVLGGTGGKRSYEADPKTKGREKR